MNQDVGGNICLVKTGTYTGDDTTGQAITGVGFQPKYVTIWLHPTAEASDQRYEKLDQSWGDYASTHWVSVDSPKFFDNRFNSLDADGFTVDDDGLNYAPNANGVTYDYMALG